MWMVASRRLWPAWDPKTKAICIARSGPKAQLRGRPAERIYPMFDDTSLIPTISCTIRPALHKSQRNVA